MTNLDLVLEEWKNYVGKNVEISGLIVKGVFKVLEAGKFGIVLQNSAFAYGTSTGDIKIIPLETIRFCGAVVCA